MNNFFALLQMFITLHDLDSHNHWTRDQLERYQQHRFHTLRAYTYRNSPFYQRFHHGLFDKPLEELPVLTKSLVMENFDDLVTDRIVKLDDVRGWLNQTPDHPFLGRYWVICTSGTSGHPGIFLFNSQEWAAVLASFARGQNFAGVSINLLARHRFAFVLSPGSHHMTNRVGKTMRSPWANLLYLSATDSLSSIVDDLNAYQPQVLGTYAKWAGMLATEQLSGRLHIQPQWVFCSGELLSRSTRQQIEEAWGVNPFNDYAATETAVIAAECKEHAGLHIYEDLLILENVDENNRPLPDGICGDKVLVTVLFSRTLPLIRYAIEDRVTIDSVVCACKRPFRRITSIQGRQADMVMLPSSRPAIYGQRSPIHLVVFAQVLDRANVGTWQIIQREDGLHINVTGAKGESDLKDLEKALRNVLETHEVQLPLIFMHPMETIPRSTSGKLLLISSELGETQVDDHSADLGR